MPHHTTSKGEGQYENTLAAWTLDYVVLRNVEIFKNICLQQQNFVKENGKLFRMFWCILKFDVESLI
jgi:hypothetical protein